MHKPQTLSHSSNEASVLLVPTSTFGAFLVFYTTRRTKVRSWHQKINIKDHKNKKDIFHVRKFTLIVNIFYQDISSHSHSGIYKRKNTIN